MFRPCGLDTFQSFLETAQEPPPGGADMENRLRFADRDRQAKRPYASNSLIGRKDIVKAPGRKTGSKSFTPRAELEYRASPATKH